MLKLFTIKKKLLSFVLTMLTLMFVQLDAGAQTGTVSGKVTDSKGEPLPGVSVMIKGEKIGTSTDGDGKFRIQAAPNQTVLVFTYIGFSSKEVKVQNTAELKVVLDESTSRLEEVVVVGYGTQKRSNVVGSVTQISSKEITQAPAMNISNVLAGRLPGLTSLQQSGRPGADDAALRIRGLGTTGGNVAPTLIVDGVERTFSQLDPNEIESITLLKDAVSASVYGLQAANGVILVTTKRGKMQKPTISYEGSMMVNSNTRFPEFLNGPDYMEWFSKAEEMDNEYRMNANQDPVALTYTKEQIEALRNGTNTNPLFGNTNWVGELLENNSVSQHHNMTVRGGTDRIKYFSSLGYLNQDGVIDNTGYDRYNLRTNLDAVLNPVVSVSLDLGARLQKTRQPGISPDNTAYMNPFYQAVRMLPNMPMYAENGLPVAYSSNAGYVNPLASVSQSGYQNSETNVFQSTLTFNVKVPWVKGLDLKLLASYDKNATENKSWLTPYPLMGRARNQTSGNFLYVANPPGITVNTVRQSYNQNNRQSFQPSITYNQAFKDHSVSVLALYEWSKSRNNLFSAGARNLPLTDLHEIDFGSVATIDFIQPTGRSGLAAREGYVGRLNYSFKNRYLFEAAVRFDASINFPKENRWGSFPSVGLGWVASEEAFMKDLSGTLNFLKFKGSIGRLGNDVTTRTFEYLSTFTLTDNAVQIIGGTPVPALYTNPIPNLNLTWEKSKLTNIGFESEFWNGKLGVDFEWFYKVTTDILNTQPNLYPPSVGGYFSSTVNSGIVDNRGFDLQLRHRNELGGFEYSVTGNLNWARNKIIRLNENTNLPFWQRKTGRSIGQKLGFVVDGFYESWEEARNGSSPSAGVIAPGFFKYRDLNGDGKITRDADMTFVGRANLPELMYGLNLEFKYKGFDLATFFQGAGLTTVALGGLYEGSSNTSGIEDNSPFTKTFYGYGNSPYYLVEQSWTPENPNAKYPRLTSGGVALSPHNANANSGFMVDGDYLRLKTVQLGYTFPKKLFNSKIDQLRVYMSGYNLFTWDKLKYLDPEMPNVNNGFYPQQRMISGGVTLTF